MIGKASGDRMAEAPLQLDNPFWRFSLAVYAAPGVEEECVALQQTHGIDVNVLLLCAWVGAERRLTLTEKNLELIMGETKTWHQTVVVPMRTVRQGLKMLPQIAETAVQDLRKGVAASELCAEQIEQALLFRAAQDLRVGAAAAEASVRGNVDTFLRWRIPSGQTFPCEHLIAAALATPSDAGHAVC
jgi:uncharacterized protein (TIGR02444 family)